MRLSGLAIGASLMIATQAVASDARFEKSLMKLAPSERLEQVCNYTAMTRIRKEAREYRPDRAVANASVESRSKGNTLNAAGAAFRSRGKWYGLTFTCTATPDHLKVTSFQYKIGAEIPETKWASYGLWD
jgi:hypothetical protein